MRSSYVQGEPTRGCRFVAAAPGRWLLVVWLMVGAGMLLHGGWSLRQGLGAPAMVELFAGVIAVVVSWAGLSRASGQEVVIRGSLLTVTRGHRVRTFDLNDPALDVLVRTEAIGFAYPREPWVVVHRRDVEWPVFQALVLDRVLRTAASERARHRGFVA